MNNSLDKQYTDLLQDILDNGVKKEDRTGTGTISVFGRQIRHKMSEGFPLLTTKKMAWKSMVVELIWFLRGDTNIKYLIDNGCNIWVGDSYKKYKKTDCAIKWLFSKAGKEPCPVDGPFYRHFTKEEFIEKIKTNDEFAKEWGELGPVYGKQWRNVKSLIERGMKNRDKWIGKPNHIDQIKDLIENLKENPDSRRLMVNAWNVGELEQMVLPPCHYGFQVYTRELTLDERLKFLHFNEENISSVVGTKGEAWNMIQCDSFNIPRRAISLSWNQRSVDTFLGLPFNIASYGLLLEILAKEVNMIPDQLIGNLGDTHLYLNHLEEAEEQIGREYSIQERIELIDSLNFDDKVKDGFKNSKELNSHVIIISEKMKYLDRIGVPRKTREPYQLPKVEINDSWKFSSKSPVFADTIKLDMIKLIEYKSHSAIKAPLSN
jgi:thymidylate synthase